MLQYFVLRSTGRKKSVNPLDKVFAESRKTRKTMPLAPREEIERIKREVSVQRLAEARGIKLRRVSKNLMGLCPFHKDTNPSLGIDPVANLWKCFGCGRAGDVIEWVKHAEG